VNFYKHHIGDYAQATAHLSFVEDAAYSRLIRKYYADEKPMPTELKAVQRLVAARTREEKEAVQTVLEEFFELQQDGWHNKRCDVELERANAQADTNRRIAEEREARRRERQQHGSLHESLTGSVHESSHPSEHESFPVREPSQTPDARHQTPDTTSQTPDLRQGEIDGTTPREEPSPRPSMATAVCLALKAEGIGSVSPGHPRLASLIAAGAEVQQFVDAARIAKAKSKASFAYILGTVEGQLADAKTLSAAGRAAPATLNGSSGGQARAARMAEAAPNLTRRPKQVGETFDMEPSDVTPRRLG
jgi:uncharacterized protein YdaU (DUF1376 family)